MGISKLQNAISPSIFGLEPNFLHQNHCFNVAHLIINVSQVNLYYFKSRHDSSNGNFHWRHLGKLSELCQSRRPFAIEARAALKLAL